MRISCLIKSIYHFQINNFPNLKYNKKTKKFSSQDHYKTKNNQKTNYVKHNQKLQVINNYYRKKDIGDFRGIRLAQCFCLH